MADDLSESAEESSLEADWHAHSDVVPPPLPLRLYRLFRLGLLYGLLTCLVFVDGATDVLCKAMARCVRVLGQLVRVYLAYKLRGVQPLRIESVTVAGLRRQLPSQDSSVTIDSGDSVEVRTNAAASQMLFVRVECVRPNRKSVALRMSDLGLRREYEASQRLLLQPVRPDHVAAQVSFVLRFYGEPEGKRPGVCQVRFVFNTPTHTSDDRGNCYWRLFHWFRTRFRGSGGVCFSNVRHTLYSAERCTRVDIESIWELASGSDVSHSASRKVEFRRFELALKLVHIQQQGHPATLQSLQKYVQMHGAIHELPKLDLPVGFTLDWDAEEEGGHSQRQFQLRQLSLGERTAMMDADLMRDEVSEHLSDLIPKWRNACDMQEHLSGVLKSLDEYCPLTSEDGSHKGIHKQLGRNLKHVRSKRSLMLRYEQPSRFQYSKVWVGSLTRRVRGEHESVFDEKSEQMHRLVSHWADPKMVGVYRSFPEPGTLEYDLRSDQPSRAVCPNRKQLRHREQSLSLLTDLIHYLSQQTHSDSLVRALLNELYALIIKHLTHNDDDDSLINLLRLLLVCVHSVRPRDSHVSDSLTSAICRFATVSCEFSISDIAGTAAMCACAMFESAHGTPSVLSSSVIRSILDAPFKDDRLSVMPTIDRDRVMRVFMSDCSAVWMRNVGMAVPKEGYFRRVVQNEQQISYFDIRHSPDLNRNQHCWMDRNEDYRRQQRTEHTIDITIDELESDFEAESHSGGECIRLSRVLDRRDGSNLGSGLAVRHGGCLIGANLRASNCAELSVKLCELLEITHDLQTFEITVCVSESSRNRLAVNRYFRSLNLDCSVPLELHYRMMQQSERSNHRTTEMVFRKHRYSLDDHLNVHKLAQLSSNYVRCLFQLCREDYLSSVKLRVYEQSELLDLSLLLLILDQSELDSRVECGFPASSQLFSEQVFHRCLPRETIETVFPSTSRMQWFNLLQRWHLSQGAKGSPSNRHQCRLQFIVRCKEIDPRGWGTSYFRCFSPSIRGVTEDRPMYLGVHPQHLSFVDERTFECLCTLPLRDKSALSGIRFRPMFEVSVRNPKLRDPPQVQFAVRLSGVPFDCVYSLWRVIPDILREWLQSHFRVDSFGVALLRQSGDQQSYLRKRKEIVVDVPSHRLGQEMKRDLPGLTEEMRDYILSCFNRSLKEQQHSRPLGRDFGLSIEDVRTVHSAGEWDSSWLGRDDFPFRSQSSVMGLWDAQQPRCVPQVLFNLVRRDNPSVRRCFEVRTHRAHDLAEFLKRIQKWNEKVNKVKY